MKAARLPKAYKKQGGFSIIELLTVMGIISVLSALGFTAFYSYYDSAYFSAVQRTVQDARTAFEAGTVEADSDFEAFDYTQLTPGGLENDAASRVFPNLRLSKQMKFEASFHPECQGDDRCPILFLQIDHCKGHKYEQWIRNGDGTEAVFELPDSAGCAP